MKKLNHDTLRDLVNANPPSPLVTIYMPTHRSSAPPNMRENQTRLKNLIRKADEIMAAKEVPNLERAQVVEQLEVLNTDAEFWKDSLHALAIFANLDGVTYFNIPIATDEYVAVDAHYHVAPLVALAHEDQPYYVLALALHKPVLYKGDMYGLEPVRIRLPESPEKALNIDELAQKQQHFHQRAGGMATGQRAGSNAKDAGEEERNNFYRMIDHKLKHACDTSLPLMLAGTTNITSEYRGVSSYPNLTDACLEGSHADSNAIELHRLSWDKISQEIINKKRHDVAERFEELKSQDRSVSDPVEIKNATDAGRVEVLSVGLSSVSADTITEGGTERLRKIVLSSEPKDELIDYCVLQAWQMGGVIYDIGSSLMPKGAQMAAILRY